MTVTHPESAWALLGINFMHIKKEMKEEVSLFVPAAPRRGFIGEGAAGKRMQAALLARGGEKVREGVFPPLLCV